MSSKADKDIVEEFISPEGVKHETERLQQPGKNQAESISIAQENS